MIPTNLVSKHRVVLFGELHGTNEIPSLLATFFQNYPGRFVVCVEIPASEDIEVFLSRTSDGRSGWSKVVAVLRDRGVPVYCVDSDVYVDQVSRELALADNVVKHLGVQTFVLTGDVHASLKSLDFGGVSFKPMGVLLKERGFDVFSVQLTAKKGAFFNGTVQSIAESLAKPGYFDSVVELDFVSAFVR